MHLLKKVSPWLRAALELVYPPSCACCHSHAPLMAPHMLCQACFDAVRRVQPPYCQRCCEPFEGDMAGEILCSNCADRSLAFDFAVCAYASFGPVRELIHQFKYEHQLHLRAVLAWLASHACDEPRLKEHADWTLVPVPLHPRRFREREFNQSAEIAAVLGKITGWPVRNCLRRVRYTTAQAHLHRDARLKNLRDAFRLKRTFRGGDPIRGLRVLLVDDVFTTGATTHECAKVLKRAGAATVAAFAVARG